MRMTGRTVALVQGAPSIGLDDKNSYFLLAVQYYRYQFLNCPDRAGTIADYKRAITKFRGVRKKKKSSGLYICNQLQRRLQDVTCV